MRSEKPLLETFCGVATINGLLNAYWQQQPSCGEERKMSGEYSVIGKRLPRKDALEKVKGEARYTSDIQLPGMMDARFLRSPYAHAGIVGKDTSRVENC